MTCASAYNYVVAIASGGVAVGNSIINIKCALVTARSSLGIVIVCSKEFSSASWDHSTLFLTLGIFNDGVRSI